MKNILFFLQNVKTIPFDSIAMTNLPTNVILTNEISSYDTQGSIIWYPIEFGLILIDNIDPRSDLIKRNITIQMLIKQYMIYTNKNRLETVDTIIKQKKMFFYIYLSI